MLTTDLKLRKPVEDSAVSTNGGRITAVEAVSNVIGNTWPHVSPTERVNGTSLHRKRFLHNSDDTDGLLLEAKTWLDVITPGDDWCTMFLGTHIDTQANITGSEAHYGTATVFFSITAGANTIVAVVEDSALLSTGLTPIFRIGGTIRLTKQVVPAITTSTAEFLTIDSISEAGNEVTITTVEQIQNTYLVADGPRVCSVLSLGDLAPSYSVHTYTGGANYNIGDYPPTLDNIGTFSQRITFTFTDSTTFTVSSDALGTLSSGNVSTNYTIVNSALSKNHLVLDFNGWAGLTITGGDTFVLDIVGSYAGIWRKRVVPAGANYIASNYTVIAWYGAAT